MSGMAAITHILFPFDFSAHGAQTVPFVRSERARQDQYRQQEHMRVVSIQREAGVDAPLRVAVGEIVPTIAEEARQENADLVIIGRRSLSEPFGRLRTHTFGIIQRSPCPVLSV